MLVNFSEKIKEVGLENKRRPKIITFLGFAGATNCMVDINNEAQNLNIDTIEASAKHRFKFSWFTSPLLKIDAILMEKFKLHLGLSRVKNQAKAAYRTIESDICSDTPIVLCGHSQGGLIAINFWHHYNHILNIKGIVLMSSPLNGVTFFKSISSIEKLRKAANLTGYSSFFKSRIEPYLIGCIYIPIFKLFSLAFWPSLLDFVGGSRFIKYMNKIYAQMKEQELKVLNITCVAPEPFTSIKFPYSIKAMRMFVSGGIGLDSDNVLGLNDQKFRNHWANLNEILLTADHGAFNVPNAPKVFHHKQALNAIRVFILEAFFGEKCKH